VINPAALLFGRVFDATRWHLAVPVWSKKLFDNLEKKSCLLSYWLKNRRFHALSTFPLPNFPQSHSDIRSLPAPTMKTIPDLFVSKTQISITRPGVGSLPLYLRIRRPLTPLIGPLLLVYLLAPSAPSHLRTWDVAIHKNLNCSVALAWRWRRSRQHHHPRCAGVPWGRYSAGAYAQ